MPAFYDSIYRNLFLECGYSAQEIQERIQSDYQAVFFGPADQRLYFPVEDQMGYILDTGNQDVRTEGMSYGMMLAVQMDDKDTFDRLWRWSEQYMLLKEGVNQGYFGWSAKTSGELNSTGPAPDGEEYFAMALLFASHRWGEGQGVLAYAAQAKAILRACVHKGESGGGRAMFDPENKLIRFIPEVDFSDPSYHLPHFYELFSLWGNPEDRVFFAEAAAASRRYLQTACHPQTGLSPEYANYDGSPNNLNNHGLFYSDAYRTAANIGLDYAWFGKDSWQRQQANAIQRFFSEADRYENGLIYTIEGIPVTETKMLVEQIDGTPTKVLHPLALLATIAQSSLAANGPHWQHWVKKFWNTPLRTDNRRYYDNLLSLFALLALSGNYRIYLPKDNDLL